MEKEECKVEIEKADHPKNGNGSLVWNVNFSIEEKKTLEPRRIYINGRTVVVWWNDGTKNQSTASKNERFDPEVGLAVCTMKKLFGKKIYGKPLYMRMLKNNSETHNLDLQAEEGMKDFLQRYSEYGKKKKILEEIDDFPF